MLMNKHDLFCTREMLCLWLRSTKTDGIEEYDTEGIRYCACYPFLSYPILRRGIE